MSHQDPLVCKGLTSLLICPAVPAAVSHDSYGVTPAAATLLYMLCICSWAALVEMLEAPAPPSAAPATLLKKEDEVWDWLGLVSWVAVAEAVLEVVKGYSELEPTI